MEKDRAYKQQHVLLQERVLEYPESERVEKMKLVHDLIDSMDFDDAMYLFDVRTYNKEWAEKELAAKYPRSAYINLAKKVLSDNVTILEAQYSTGSLKDRY
jgi:hypothetical protein